jgi:hypothetical protein
MSLAVSKEHGASQQLAIKGAVKHHSKILSTMIQPIFEYSEHADV